jgi:hypothetical protein
MTLDWINTSDLSFNTLLLLERLTTSGGMVILCLGNNDVDNQAHSLLIDHSYSWSRFEEPQDGWKRKYWKTI